MKILVICQHYYPEPFRLPDVCAELVRRGHDVTVITAQPNYPMGKIYDGYGGKKHAFEEKDGVKICRTFTIARKNNAFFRILNYYSYALSSARLAKKLDGDFDVVFVNQLSPVMMANAGIAYKRKYGKKMLVYCLDLWPESLTVGGVKKGSIPYRIFHAISKSIYKSADRLLISSKAFGQYFKDEFGMEDVKFMPQYAEELFDPASCAKKPDKTVDLMFAGNVGSAQNVDVIIEAARLTEGLRDIVWHIVGDGSDYERIRRSAKELKNVRFYGRLPIEKMPEMYAKADAMLVTMADDEFLSKTLPGRVQTYLAAGKPVLASANGETRRVIEDAKCGLCCCADDAVALAENAIIFADGEKTQYARAAAEYYRDNFSRKKFVDTLEAELITLGGGE